MLHRIATALILCSVMLTVPASRALAQKDKIEGLWYNAEQTAKVQIYKAVDGKFWGKIVWLKEPNKDGRPKTDENNPKEKLRNTPLLNLPILRAFTKKNEKTYDDGEIYDPKNGKTYSCTITYRNDKELGIRGYIGISMIGRTTTWKRAEGN
jgi:uncharacterized protein (DUF2147 family)